VSAFPKHTFRIPDAEALAGRPTEQVLVGIEVVVLHKVIVDVFNREQNANPIQSHRSEVKHNKYPKHI
jgi:hypothetical protein